MGTGILGAIACYPIATLLLGQKATLFGFIPSFIFSSFTGAIDRVYDPKYGAKEIILKIISKV